MSTKKQKIRPTDAYPELMELLVDIAIFTQKYTTPELARRVEIKKQSLQQQINKKMKGASK